MAPTHTPPANLVRTELFLKPTNQPSQLTDRPSTVDLLATNPAKHRSATKSTADATQTSEPTGQQTSQRHLASAFDTTRKDSSSSSDSDSDSLSSDHPPVDIYVEEGELSDEQEVTITNPDQSSEEQSYREAMKGIRSYMGWNHIPDIDSGATTSDDNPFADPKLQTPGKVSVNLPTDEWLCRKMSELNLTLVHSLTHKVQIPALTEPVGFSVQ